MGYVEVTVEAPVLALLLDDASATGGDAEGLLFYHGCWRRKHALVRPPPDHR
jgi:hypothetical protein